MARKITPKVSRKAPPSSGADDLAIMHPDSHLTIAGRDLVVREYGFIEGLQLRAAMQPFTAALEALFAGGSEALIEDITDVLGQHVALVQQAIAQSIAAPGELASADDVAWIAGLNDADGDALLMVWWGVCGPFFLRQLTRRLIERAQRKACGGATSTPSSSAPSSAHPTSSAATPGGSSSSTTAA